MFSNNAATDLYYCTDKGQDILKSCTIQANKENLSYCSPLCLLRCFVLFQQDLPEQSLGLKPW